MAEIERHEWRVQPIDTRVLSRFPMLNLWSRRWRATARVNGELVYDETFAARRDAEIAAGAANAAAVRATEAA